MDGLQLVMIAGPNGSGKSTLIAALRADTAFQLPALYINADDIQRERGLADPRQAQAIANQMRSDAIAQHRELMFETVMSHPSRIAELQRARAEGYEITVHFVATENPRINVSRVAVRVDDGGHEVSQDRIVQRYERTLNLAPVALSYADRAFVFDNSEHGSTGGGLSLHAELAGGAMHFLSDAPMPWVQALVERVRERAYEMKAFASVQELAPVLARLDHSDITGPVIAVGKHYVLQYDPGTRLSVLHDRTLLGEAGAKIATHDDHRIAYHEGIATVEGPLRSSSR